jgi:hypothetical protein
VDEPRAEKAKGRIRERASGQTNAKKEEKVTAATSLLFEHDLFRPAYARRSIGPHD